MHRASSPSPCRAELVCTNEDLIRNSAYNWSPMSADEISAKTGIEARRYTADSLEELSLRAARAALAHAQVGPEQIGAVLVCTCTSDRLIPSVATWLSGQLGIQQTHCSFDLVAACAGLSYGLAEATFSNWCGGRCWWCAEKFSNKIGNAAIADDLRRRRGRHCRRRRAGGFTAGYRVHADLCQRSDQPGQLDPVAQPRVRQQHHGLWPRGEEARGRYLMQMLDDIQRADDGVAESLLASIELIIPHQANKTMVIDLAKAAGLSPDQLYFNIERVGNASSASIPPSTTRSATR